MKSKNSKYKPTANPEMAKAMQEIRRSGASGQHLDKRTRRQRTRQSAAYRAIIESKEGN